ncbi:stress-induced protein [Pantoea wallisii]|uniref:Stress-induced protein n=1 Tax=Pantoea wallisii TaxID=1076551 RepID=A0A1X1D454_9GAMM|nr:KGG domain-containing protein [Pantoea wallisii]ORM71436.1 stress-induced protein [Pantoea wallisii]
MTQHRGGSGNFADDKQKASEAGKKGGQSSGGGNFKNDREKASEAGKKGGQSSKRGS